MRSTCPYCGVGCGVLARTEGARIEIVGDPAHPANRGRLCSKGSALAGTLTLEGRLLHPRLRGERVAWDTALEAVAQGFSRIIAEHGPDSVAFYVSGQLLTEDYYVANKLMKGWIGSANIDTNSRLCMSSAVAAHKRAFGEDLVPGCYEDFELADLVVIVGSNMAWCHPVLLQRLLAAREARPDLRLVVIDPRRTATAEMADLHLALAPGSDVWLFNGLLAHLAANGAIDADYIAAHTSGFDAALAAAADACGDLDAVAAATGLAPEDLATFYRWFAATPRVVTAFSQGVNQSSCGTDKATSLINCHLATGRIGRPGMGPFSLTGQPNAMGGREVGGLANQLAAHRELDNPDDRAAVQGFWGSPRIASRSGSMAVEMFDEIQAGRIKAVWIMATNPVVSLPDADRVRAALARAELVVVSDCIAATDTTAFAHVLLPASGWGEKDGTVTNSERCLSRQRAFRPPPGEARPDWWIICEVARRMGHTGFEHDSPAAIFREHAALASLPRSTHRRLDLGALATVDRAAYDDLDPAQWPLAVGRSAPAARLCGDGRFATPDGRARFVPTPPRRPAHATDADFPLVLNTGRIRDQWHTMSRTGLAPRLGLHTPEPFIDAHATTLARTGIEVGALAQVVTRFGRMTGRVRSSGEVPPGTVFAPIHWSDTNASTARVGALVNPAVDPVSGQPELKHTPARLAPYPVARHGVAVSREALPVAELTWWARARLAGAWRHEFALAQVPGDPSHWARVLLCAEHPNADWIEYLDPGAANYRAACFVDSRLQGYIALGAVPPPVSREWLAQRFAAERIGDEERMELLAGRPVSRCDSAGPTVCVCFGIGRDAITAGIVDAGLRTPREVGERLRAGTNCGSCVPEIRRLIEECRRQPDAA